MTLNCNGKIINFDDPQIMGILNVSDDSFYDGGKFNSIEKALSHVNNMINDGADIIDLGGISSKPGSKIIDGKTELNIVSKYIDELSRQFNKITFSIDTYNSNVAGYALNKGFSIINDISAGKYDNKLLDVVKDYSAGYVLMHMKGDPENMQQNIKYNDPIPEVFSFFKEKLVDLEKININNIIIDPGFGFGKNINHNYQILKELKEFKKFNKPILVGISRKSMIYNKIKSSSSNSLNGTTVLNTFSIINGASILRVHDVKEAVESINLLNDLI